MQPERGQLYTCPPAPSVKYTAEGPTAMDTPTPFGVLPSVIGVQPFGPSQHCAAEHTGVNCEVHTVPQEPQFFVSVCSSTQVLEQKDRPGVVHVQVALRQTVPGGPHCKFRLSGTGVLEQAPVPVSQEPCMHGFGSVQFLTLVNVQLPP